ncbi:MAG: uracil phosphoribosyltransferase [Ignavibacteria bacterium]|nr:uracil phosphoribosyltransferase [Ignavibacteria bacterium]
MIEIIFLDHPLSLFYLSKIRDKKTDVYDFRKYMDRLSFLIASYAYSDLKLRRKIVQTPLLLSDGYEINGEVVLMPILRAGLGLMKGFEELFPSAMISHIGIYRNENTLKPVKYYFKFPDVKNIDKTSVFILDPMIATGGSMIYALKKIKEKKIKSVTIASLLCAPEGIKELEKEFQDKNFKILIYTCSLDKKLNKSGYIVPGLGDAGDRYFGT